MKQYLHFFRACALVILLGAISNVGFSATITSIGGGGGNWSSSAWLNAPRTGTITTSLASTAVTGVGTAFLNEINVGSVLKTLGGAIIGTVASVTDNTHLTLVANAASAITGLGFQFQGMGPTDVAHVKGGDVITIDIPNAACASIAGDGTSAVGPWQLVFPAGNTLTVTGTASIGDPLNAGIVDMTAGGTFKVGSLTTANAGSSLIPGLGTIEITGSTATTIPAVFNTFNNLTISGGTTTTGGALTINGNLQIGTGTSNFVAAAFPLTVTGTTTIGAGTGKLTISSATGAKVFNGQVIVNGGGNWTNTANTNVEFHGGLQNNGGTINWGTGIQIFNTNNQQLTNNFSIPNVEIDGITLTNPGTLEITGALTGTGGILKQGPAATLDVNYPGVTPAGVTIDATAANNTVSYTNAGAQTVIAGNYYNLVLSGGSAKTLTAGTTTIGGDLSLTGSGTSATAGGSLTISGNVTTDLGTTLHAGDYTHYIGGNLANNGIFDGGSLATGTGTIVLNGNADQTILNSIVEPDPVNDPLGLNHTVNITVDKTVGNVILLSDITAVKGLNMISGNIILNTHNLILGTGAAEVGVLTHTNGAIVGSGKFIRWFSGAIVPASDAAGLFPVGSTTVYRPLYIAIPVAVAAGTVAVEYHDGTGNAQVSPSIPDGGVNDIVVRKNFSWEISDPTAAPLNLDPAKYPPLGDGDYNVTAVGTNPGQVTDVADLRLMLASSVVGSEGTNGGSTTVPEVTRTVNNGVSGTNLFNTFYIGSTDPSSTALPITLLSFTASPVNGSVKLDWETTSEINNDHFTIQRSRNAIDWESIKVVPGAVNSSVNVKYTEYDESPYQGVSYYRLQQTDRDGKTSFSPIVSVKIGQSASINVYPNPTADHIYITTIGSGRLNVTLYNNNGRMINVPVTVNGNSARLDVGTLSAGTYFVHILQGGQSESRVVLIAK